MSGADDPDLGVVVAEERGTARGQVPDRAGRRLRTKRSPGVGVLEGVLDEVDRLLQDIRNRVIVGSVTVSGFPA